MTLEGKDLQIAQLRTELNLLKSGRAADLRRPKHGNAPADIHRDMQLIFSNRKPYRNATSAPPTDKPVGCAFNTRKNRTICTTTNPYTDPDAFPGYGKSYGADPTDPLKCIGHGGDPTKDGRFGGDSAAPTVMDGMVPFSTLANLLVPCNGTSSAAARR